MAFLEKDVRDVVVVRVSDHTSDLTNLSVGRVHRIAFPDGHLPMRKCVLNCGSDDALGWPIVRTGKEVDVFGALEGLELGQAAFEPKLGIICRVRCHEEVDRDESAKAEPMLWFDDEMS